MIARDYEGTIWRSKDRRDNGRTVVVTEARLGRSGIYLELNNTVTGRTSYIGIKDLEKRFIRVHQEASHE